MRKLPHYMNANKPIASLAYSRLRELTRDDVLDVLHPALRPDIVAVLDENAELRGKLASANGALVGSRDARARTEQELAELREAVEIESLDDNDERPAKRGTSECDGTCDPQCQWCLVAHDCHDECAGGPCPYDALVNPPMATMDELAQTITGALRARGIRDITEEDFPTWDEARVRGQDNGATLCLIHRKRGVHKIGCWLLNLEQAGEFAQWLANAPASYDIDGAMKRIT